MPKVLEDDAELHQQVLAFSQKHACSYLAALHAVVDLAKQTGRSVSAAVGTLQQDDHELDDLVKTFALEKGCSYVDALSAISAVAGIRGISPLAAAKAVLEDSGLRQRADAFSREQGVKFPDALRALAAIASIRGKSASFAECDLASSAELSDQQLCDAATVYAALHLVSFSEGLTQCAEVRHAHRQLAAVRSFTSHATAADQALHERALTMVAMQSVSYSEALSLCESGTCSFAQSTGPAPGLSAKEVEIFKAGQHTDMNGKDHYFTQEDLEGIAAAYDPTLREAPLTIGHSDTNEPAYGWVKSLTATGAGKLVMEAHQVDAEFAKLVNAGRYKKRSADFYPPNHPNNPKRGTWYLRHVAWLGAAQPAIAGLRDHRFAPV